jgi:phage host-nuclease inhibitor protein Gam
MRRNDPLLLPICQICGKYKGVGYCNDPNCRGSKPASKREDVVAIKNRFTNKSCSLCDEIAVLSCCRCNQGYCKAHGIAYTEEHLVKLDQHVGTCSICNQIVCENCWILESDGTISCLEHHEGGPRHHE